MTSTSEGGYDPAPQESAVHLTPREVDKLLIFLPASWRANAAPAVSSSIIPKRWRSITSEILELIRDGRSVAEIMSLGPTILAADAVMDGVPSDDPRDSDRGARSPTAPSS